MFFICEVLALDTPADPIQAIKLLNFQIRFAEDFDERIHELDMEYRREDKSYRAEFFEIDTVGIRRDSYYRVSAAYIAGLKARRDAIYNATVTGLISL